jgi:hypothetical protein
MFFCLDVGVLPPCEQASPGTRKAYPTFAKARYHERTQRTRAHAQQCIRPH